MKHEVDFRMAVALSALFVIGAASAQDVVVPQVTTGSAGGYAQPLQLDTDRYRREQAGQRSQKRDRVGATPGGQPSQAEIDAVMARLAPEYRRRVQRDGEQSALVWLRQAAFEAGQEAGSQRRR